MKTYETSLDKLEILADFIKQCNPPEGMTKEEMLNKFAEILKEIQRR